ncbi:hypothetical protein [Vibrio phage CKB-S1]|nr:hypothetical protein [Vibrio phage CKB-S1]
MTIRVQNRTINGITIFDAVFDDATLKAAAAETWPAGAVLAQDTSDNTYVRYNPSGSNGTNIPSAVLTQPVTFDAAGNVPGRPAFQGRFRLEDLVDSADAALTQAARLGLRDYAILTQSTRQITIQDNQ